MASASFTRVGSEIPLVVQTIFIHLFQLILYRRCKEWLKILDLEDFPKRVNRALSTLYCSSYRFCELHFTKEQMGGQRPYRTAVPSKDIVRPVPMAMPADASISHGAATDATRRAMPKTVKCRRPKRTAVPSKNIVRPIPVGMPAHASISHSATSDATNSATTTAGFPATSCAASNATPVVLLKATLSRTGLVILPGVEDSGLQVVGGNYSMSDIQSGNLQVAVPCKIDSDDPLSSLTTAVCTPVLPVVPTCPSATSSSVQRTPVQPPRQHSNSSGLDGHGELSSVPVSHSPGLIDMIGSTEAVPLRVIGRTVGRGGRAALIATCDNMPSASVSNYQRSNQKQGVFCSI